MKISLVIPNYRNLESLKKLLNQTKNLGFYKIFVLDDNSPKEVTDYLADLDYIELRRSNTRLYPTANRNRILKEDTGDWILFLDSDMQIIGKRVIYNLKTLIKKYPKAKVFGGLILSHSNEPMWFNYGRFLSPFLDKQLDIWVQVGVKFWKDSENMAWVREQAKELNYNFWEPKERRVDWIAEGLFLVNSKLFKTLNGFDESFKMYYEGCDFCKRVWNKGFEVIFSPKIKVKHLENDNVGDKKRVKYMVESAALWYEKHYGIPREIYKKQIEPGWAENKIKR